MPTPNKGESERDFVKRCVPVLIDEGKKPDQAVAVCHSLYDEHKGMKHSRQWASASLVLSAPDQDFRDAVVLGQGLPMQREGQPVKYFWKEVLRPGEYRDKDGKQFEITANRIDTLHNNFVRAKQKGFQPWVPNGHTSDATKNMGFVIDARKNDKGGLDLLHQLIGSDAILAAQRNKSSIFTVSDYTDENGEHYDELILHNAICPDPQLSNLDDFQPAIAASRGATASATVLSLASSQQEPEMALDLKKLREIVGAETTTDEVKVIEMAVAKLTEGKGALELSKTRATELEAATKRATDAERERDEHKARVLELSKGEPDPATLEDRRITAEEVLTGFVERGQCTDGMAKIIREHFIGAEKQPCLMLSRGARSGPVGAVFKLLELNKELKGFRQTDGQPVPRHVPGNDDDKNKPLTPERRRDLLAHVGIAASAASAAK